MFMEEKTKTLREATQIWKDKKEIFKGCEAKLRVRSQDRRTGETGQAWRQSDREEQGGRR